MKTILFLCLICLTLSEDSETSQYNKGPAHNYKHEQSEKYCEEYFVYTPETKWYDAGKSDENVPQGVSDCVDTLLYDNEDRRYYDRCCYIRMQSEGVMHSGCFSLNEDEYLDIAETMRKIEQGDKNVWVYDNIPESKVYQLDCHSTFVKVLTGASILLALIL